MKIHVYHTAGEEEIRICNRNMQEELVEKELLE